MHWPADGISDDDVSTDSSDAAVEEPANVTLDSDENGAPSDSYINNSESIGDDLSSAEYNEILDEIRNENVVTDGEYMSENKGDAPLDGVSEYKSYDSDMTGKTDGGSENGADGSKQLNSKITTAKLTA